MFSIFISCNKQEPDYKPVSMTVTLPRLDLHQGLYYQIGVEQRSIELDFNETLDTSTIQDNILLSESGNLLNSQFTLLINGRKAVIRFLPSFFLKEGWQYMITIGTKLRTLTGKSFPKPHFIELRTNTFHPLVTGSDTSRASIICISDLHMNDQRATALGYSWFGKNMSALDSLFSSILKSTRVKQLVILGDLFDEWAVPYRINPLDPAAGIQTTREYFLAVAANPVNSNIVNKLKQIATSGKTQLIYVQGNHDMLLTEAILQEIIPGIQWEGDATGLGHHSPVTGIVMEHGHRYDFFNAPQPLVQPGHILPPGYFITRLDAQGMMENNKKQPKASAGVLSDAAFLTAWTAAFTYLELHYNLTVAPDSANIRMGDIDGYAGPDAFNATRDRYAANIESIWPATMAVNQMPVAMPVTMAIIDGNSDLYAAATMQYMQSMSPVKHRIVVFGHTHHAMLKVYPAGSNYSAIYGNTGTWVDDQLTSHPVRTFIEILPGVWNGSSLDVISLYRYNPTTDQDGTSSGFSPELIAQESILR
jgi:UDP-2,3-diacylglucosamine pyrophosphatase LpxH